MRKQKKTFLFRLTLIVFLFLAMLGAKEVWEKSNIQAATMEKGWNLILVNQYHYIPENYEVELVKLDNGKQVDKKIYAPLQEMFSAAEEEDIYMVVVEAYRKEEEQEELMDEKVEEYTQKGVPGFLAKKFAEKWVAKPGTSEHQLGIAVDINPDYSKSDRDSVYDWLAENSYLYGFIYRYPEDKAQITGINNEPWHYRYVGIEAATEMYEQDICLEEYLE